MNMHNVFQDKLGCHTADDVFDYLIVNLKETIVSYDYFVNWNKVLGNYHPLEVALNILNVLIGKKDIESEALALFAQHPDLIKIIPALLATRDTNIKILDNPKTFNIKEFDFIKSVTPADAVAFMKKAGFLELLSNQDIKSVPDYFLGVEVGLDSNGRKNRSGTAMETLVELHIQKICSTYGYDYIAQATADKIQAKWNKHITVKNSSKRIDFAIKTPNKLFLIETNFYSGGGSKLKSTAGEYIDAFNQWKADGHEFIWITDGHGWVTTQRPLRDTFNVTDYILNISMIQDGVLEELLK